MGEPVTLKLRGTEKNGTASYVLEGVRGSVRLNKNMFTDGAKAPDSITIEVDGLAKPGEVKVGATAKLTPEALATANARAEKAQLRATKALARAEKLAARAAKLGIAAPAPLAESAPAPDAAAV